MFQTCVKSQMSKMPNKIIPLILSSVLLGSFAVGAQAQSKSSKKSGAIEAPVAGAVTVSDYEFNTFAFSSAIKRIFFPAGSPVVGKPVYLADNMQVMLQFGKGHTKPIQMVAELESGDVVSLRVVPRSVAGVVHTVNGARLRGSGKVSSSVTPNSGEAGAPRGEDIELLKQLISKKEPPAGFDPVSLPSPTRFDKFSVVPLAGWSDGSKRILVFSLVAVPGQTAVVAPPQFYRAGISAVMVDGDVVDGQNSPQLFVVEELNDE